MTTNRYSKGKIYRLVNSVDEEIYVGSTCDALHKRLYKHKFEAKTYSERNVYKHLNEVGWDNVKIVLIEEYSCQNKNELERRERQLIEELKPSLNRNIPTRTKQEWRDINKEVLLEKNKQYYQNNKEIILERSKEYSHKNRETKLNYLKEYYKKHKDTAKEYYEKNKEHITQKSKEYYNKNKEAINARRREKYALKKQQTSS